MNNILLFQSFRIMDMSDNGLCLSSSLCLLQNWELLSCENLKDYQLVSLELDAHYLRLHRLTTSTSMNRRDSEESNCGLSTGENVKSHNENKLKGYTVFMASLFQGSHHLSFISVRILEHPVYLTKKILECLAWIDDNL